LAKSGNWDDMGRTTMAWGRVGDDDAGWTETIEMSVSLVDCGDTSRSGLSKGGMEMEGESEG
jgi:hypothetical protein